MKYSIVGTITEKDGRNAWVPNSINWWRTVLSKFKIGDSVTIRMTEKKPTRSESQNNLYFMYLNNIAKEKGYSSKDIHEWAKEICLPSEVKEILGDTVTVKKSTTELNKSEFTEYLLKIQAKTGVKIPDTEGYILDSIYQGEESEIDYPEGDLTPKF